MKEDLSYRIFENVAEASKKAGRVYIIYISFLIYFTFTAMNITDMQIVLDGKTSLPIINLQISITWFFITAPIISIVIFVYFQLYLYKIKDLINSLKDICPLGVVRKLVYPWILNTAEFEETGIIGIIQRLIVKFTVWYTLPLVLIIVSFSAVRKHHPIISYATGIIPFAGLITVIFFWCKYESIQIRKVFKNFKMLILIVVICILEIFLLFFLIPYVNKGETNRFISYLESFTFVDLSYKKLITEPKKDYKGSFWCNLKDTHLEKANLTNTILKRADLRNSFLQKANLSWAMLEEANLSYANLQGARLEKANLKRAILENAKLQNSHLNAAILEGANLSNALLQGARLSYADLKDAKLEYANFQGAVLKETKLDGANLRGADLLGVKSLSISQLSKVKCLFQTKIETKLFEEVKSKLPHLLEKPKEKPDQIDN